MLILALLSSTLLLQGVYPWPSGAPDSACATMIPGHGVGAQSGTPPYEVTVSSNTYAASGTLTVTISKTGATGFKGFILQARRADPSLDTDELIGTFAAVTDTKNVCGVSNGLTHTSSSDKDSIGPITWTAPSSLQGHLYFVATVVQAKETFWTSIQSEMVSDPTAPPIVEQTQAPETPPPTTNATPTNPPPTTNATPTNPPTNPPGGALDPIDTSECGITKHCMSSPADCTDDCKIRASWTKPVDGIGKIDVQLEGTSDGWIALGFSSTDKMPDTSATVCIIDGSIVNVEQIWNDGYSPEVLTPSDTGLSNTEGATSDGKIMCKFTRDVVVSGNDKFFDLNEAAFIIAGFGPAAGGNIAPHTESPTSTSEKLNIEDDFVNLGGTTKKSPLVRAHGILMTFAWMFCVNVAIILARFYKKAWPGKMVLGGQVWFTFHRILQVFCLICTSIAFILIFVEVQGFTVVTSPGFLKAHAPIGIVVTILVFVNPFMSLCRCAPDHKRRPIFNWAHWAVGIIAQILATIEIFFGIQMPKAKLFAPGWLTYIMATFVVIQFVTTITLEILRCKECKSESKDKGQYGVKGEENEASKQEYEMNQPGEDKPAAETSHTYKYVILAVYVSLVAGLFIVMLVGLAA